MTNVANFQINKQVIAIRDHSGGDFRTGDVFTIQGIKRGCKCNPVLLDIGLVDSGTYCGECGADYSNKEMYYSAAAFKPYKERKGKHTIESLMKELEPSYAI